MAQVNSAPGQNQVFGNVAVASAVSEATGVPDVKAVSVANTVTYAQKETGVPGDPALRPKRS